MEVVFLSRCRRYLPKVSNCPVFPSAPLVVEGAGASRQQSPFSQSMRSVLGLSFTGNGQREKIKRGPWGLKVKVRALQGQGTGCERLTGANLPRAEI